MRVITGRSPMIAMMEALGVLPPVSSPSRVLIVQPSKINISDSSQKRIDKAQERRERRNQKRLKQG